MVKNERFTLERDVRVGAWLQGLAWDAADAKSIFDLDVAACDESFWAKEYYTKDEDGLASPWDGNVWLNPPFSELKLWTERIWLTAGASKVRSVTYYIPGDRIEQPFWHKLIEPFRDGRDGGAAPFQLDVHNMIGRSRFGFHGNPSGEGVGSPPFKMAYLIFRRRGPGQILAVPHLTDCPLLKDIVP